MDAAALMSAATVGGRCGTIDSGVQDFIDDWYDERSRLLVQRQEPGSSRVLVDCR